MGGSSSSWGAEAPSNVGFRLTGSCRVLLTVGSGGGRAMKTASLVSTSSTSALHPARRMAGWSDRISAPAGVHEIVVAGAHARIVGGEEQGERRHVRGHHALPEAQVGEEARGLAVVM